MNIFPSISLETPYMCSWNPQNRARFSKMINLKGHMPRFTLKHEHFPIYLLGNPIHVYVLKPLEQGLFFQDDQFEGSHA